MNNGRVSWSVPTKLVITLITLGFVVFLLYKFSAAIMPTVLALVIAYVLAPPVSSLQRKLRIPRGLAMLMVYLLFTLILAAALMLIIPTVGNQFAAFGQDLQRLLDQARELFSTEINIYGFTINEKEVASQLTSSLQSLLNPIFGTTLGVLTGILTSLVWVVYIFMVSLYLVKDADIFTGWLEQLPPPDYRSDFRRLRDEIAGIWRAFFRGQLLLALVVSVIISIEASIIGLRFALVMGLLAGMLEFLPSIGHTIWIVLAGLLALLGGSTWIPVPNWIFALIVLGLHLVYTQFDMNYLIPAIIGRRVHLPPIVVILGIVVGALVAGVLGVVLAAPTIASLRVLSRYIYAQLVDMDPFPLSAQKSEALPPPNPRWWRLRPLKFRRPWSHSLEDQAE